MTNIILLSIGLIILYFIIKAFRSAPRNPQRFAQSIAKAQLTSLNAFRNKNPSLSKEDLYIKALSSRPGCSESKIKQCLDNAKNEQRGKDNDMIFKLLVIYLVLHEYHKRTKIWSLDPSTIAELSAGVDSIIPDDL